MGVFRTGGKLLPLATSMRITPQGHSLPHLPDLQELLKFIRGNPEPRELR
ncbi:MAG: hypothetical protein ICV54_27720 [Nostoc sp. C3-bin3]|nr:hypothetical protein [Nostoc sp. C3-bin3]